MAAPSAWPTIHAERAALVEDLSSLPDDKWRTASLCGGWTVREVLGHLTAAAKLTPPAFFLRFAGSGFRFDAMTARDIARETAGTAADGLAEFRRVLDRTSAPPGPTDTWLGEVIVHGEDIRRPLGIKHDYPMDALKRVADFYKGSNLLIGAKNRIAGLTMTATDTDWSTGSGPEVRGPMLSLVMAMTGRSAALADLSGEGLDTLRARMS